MTIKLFSISINLFFAALFLITVSDLSETVVSYAITNPLRSLVAFQRLPATISIEGNEIYELIRLSSSISLSETNPHSLNLFGPSLQLNEHTNLLEGERNITQESRVPAATRKTISTKHKQQISEANRGKSTWNRGLHHSEETKRKISEAVKRRAEEDKAEKIRALGMTSEEYEAMRQALKKKRSREYKRSKVPVEERQKRRSEKMKINWQDPNIRQMYITSRNPKKSVKSLEEAPTKSKSVSKANAVNSRSRKRIIPVSTSSSEFHHSTISINKEEAMKVAETTLFIESEKDTVHRPNDYNNTISSSDLHKAVGCEESLVFLSPSSQTVSAANQSRKTLSLKNTVPNTEASNNLKQTKSPAHDTSNTRKRKRFEFPDVSILDNLRSVNDYFDTIDS